MQITIDKVLQELGRMHLENMRLSEEVSALQGQIAAATAPASETKTVTPGA